MPTMDENIPPEEITDPKTFTEAYHEITADIVRGLGGASQNVLALLTVALLIMLEAGKIMLYGPDMRDVVTLVAISGALNLIAAMTVHNDMRLLRNLRQIGRLVEDEANQCDADMGTNRVYRTHLYNHYYINNHNFLAMACKGSGRLFLMWPQVPEQDKMNNAVEFTDVGDRYTVTKGPDEGETIIVRNGEQIYRGKALLRNLDASAGYVTLAVGETDRALALDTVTKEQIADAVMQLHHPDSGTDAAPDAGAPSPM